MIPVYAFDYTCASSKDCHLFDARNCGHRSFLKEESSEAE